MGELYENSIFNRRDQEPRQQSNLGNRLFLIVVMIAAIGILTSAFFAWRWWNTPHPVDINTASIEQLQSIPDVGPAIAKGIVAGRPYSKIEDLKKVSGIGDKTFEKMKAHVRVE